MLAATVRAVRWYPVAAGWLLALGFVAWKSSTADATAVLRVVAVLLVTGVVGLLDDPAADVTASAPVPLLRRYVVRLFLAFTAVAVPWGLGLAWVRPSWTDWALSLECLALLVIGLGVAVGSARWWDAANAGLVAGPAVLAVAVGAAALSARWTLYAAAAGALAVWAVALRDPAARGGHRFGDVVASQRAATSPK